jgi:hypothetical protein
MMGWFASPVAVMAIGFQLMPKHGGKREGAGRKAEGAAPKQKITITLPPELIEWIDQQSSNRSKFIEGILKDAASKSSEPIPGE